MFKDMIESLNKLAEEALDGVDEEILSDIPAEEPEIQPEVEEPVNGLEDNMSLADTLDAKTKIARALENLKIAIDEFKEASAEKVDLLKDELLLGGIAGLDDQVKAIEAALAAGSNILGDSELNDPFKTELPAEPEIGEEESEETSEIEDEESEEDDGEIADFDVEAGFDLLGGEAEQI